MSNSYIPESIRREVIRRANSLCEYCGSPLDVCPDPFAVEHIIPRAAGGTDHLDNLALSCQGCNNFKSIFQVGSDPLTGDWFPLYHPRLHRWDDHFLWSDDRGTMLGKTAIGRATIARLQLNRSGVVNLRRLVHFAREHNSE